MGPDWHEGFSLHGTSKGKNVEIEYETECIRLLNHAEYLDRISQNTSQGMVFYSNLHLLVQTYDLKIMFVCYPEDSDSQVWPVYGELSNGKIYGCDFVISATGVVPNCEGTPARHDPEKGIFVNCRMETETKDVYAAGDVCWCNWNWSPHWFQVNTIINFLIIITKSISIAVPSIYCNTILFDFTDEAVDPS